MAPETDPIAADDPAPDATAADTRYVGWNDATILNVLGNSPAAIRRALISQKQGTNTEPTNWAIYQWISRGHIAHAWRARLVYTALRLGRVTPVEVFRIE